MVVLVHLPIQHLLSQRTIGESPRASNSVDLATYDDPNELERKRMPVRPNDVPHGLLLALADLLALSICTAAICADAGALEFPSSSRTVSPRLKAPRHARQG